MQITDDLFMNEHIYDTRGIYVKVKSTELYVDVKFPKQIGTRSLDIVLLNVVE